jgi:beta-glucanase (GH16 family)
VQKAIHPAGSDQCALDPNCISAKASNLANIRTGLIDPDTPKSAMTRKDKDGNTQALVFSDEFNEDGRTFYPNDDPYFQGMDFWYGVTQDMEVSFATYRELCERQSADVRIVVRS